ATTIGDLDKLLLPETTDVFAELHAAAGHTLVQRYRVVDADPSTPALEPVIAPVNLLDSSPICASACFPSTNATCFSPSSPPCSSPSAGTFTATGSGGAQIWLDDIDANSDGFVDPGEGSARFAPGRLYALSFWAQTTTDGDKIDISFAWH